MNEIMDSNLLSSRHCAVGSSHILEPNIKLHFGLVEESLDFVAIPLSEFVTDTFYHFFFVRSFRREYLGQALVEYFLDVFWEKVHVVFVDK